LKGWIGRQQTITGLKWTQQSNKSSNDKQQDYLAFLVVLLVTRFLGAGEEAGEVTAEVLEATSAAFKLSSERTRVITTGSGSAFKPNKRILCISGILAMMTTRKIAEFTITYIGL